MSAQLDLVALTWTQDQRDDYLALRDALDLPPDMDRREMVEHVRRMRRQSETIDLIRAHGLDLNHGYDGGWSTYRVARHQWGPHATDPCEAVRRAVTGEAGT